MKCKIEFLRQASRVKEGVAGQMTKFSSCESGDLLSGDKDWTALCGTLEVQLLNSPTTRYTVSRSVDQERSVTFARGIDKTANR